MSTETIIHVIRHAHIPSHESDVALTEEGWEAAYRTGQEFARTVGDKEQIVFLHGPARRARETAQAMHRGFAEALATRSLDIQVAAPTQHMGLCNVRLLMDGRLQEAMRLFYDAVQAEYRADPSPENAARLEYHHGFWNADDPMGYWLTHPSPYAEDPEQVAARIRDVIREQLVVPPTPPAHRRRVFCASHSGPMRAFLRQVLGVDPGEPDFCEYLTATQDANGAVRVEFRGRVSWDSQELGGTRRNSGDPTEFL